MKKVLSLALASLLTVSLAATVGAMEGNEKLGTIPYITDEIVIDGEMDAIYATGLKTEVATIANGASDATATCYLVHDGENLYLYAEVKDADLVTPEQSDLDTQPWVCDSLELMIDGSNNDTVDVTQTRLGWTGWASWYVEGGIEAKNGDDTYPEVQDCAAIEIDGGYAVEMALNMVEFGVTPGTDIGIQYQINDVFSDGTSQANITINGSGPWVNTDYPVATVDPVVEKVVEPETTAEEVVDTATETTTAPATFDVAVVAAVAAVLSAAGYAVSKKH